MVRARVIWQVVVVVPREDGTARPTTSVLLTWTEARDLARRYERLGYQAEVVVAADEEATSA